ncbi:MAG: phosphatidate cytidylyltransferase [Rhodobacter sp.]|nr:phosphatidate cytidylyltransferase [Rhodobacter sp.]
MALDIDTIALTCLVLLGVGYVAVLGLLPFRRYAPAAKETLPILHAEAVIVIAAVGAVWVGGWVLTLCLIALTLRIGFEAAFVALARRGARLRVVLPAGAALAAAVLLGATQPLEALIWPSLAALALCGLLVWLRIPNPISYLGVSLLLAAFPGIPLMIFVAAGNQDLGVWLLAAFFLVETFDSYALLGGKLFGRTKAFPLLSPRKTVEGLAAGAVMLMLTAALVGKLLFDAPVPASAGLALCVGVLAVAGDLAASRLKRLSGIKDYPPVIRNQGGLLDITDAWIAAGAGLAVFAVLSGLA